ncbi:MAG: MOSC domain-containing protein [Candidatus Caldatribacteriota bacterium]|nr:MOSC domain-containing protein [Candidatus Caldatribacteriota bacterium]
MAEKIKGKIIAVCLSKMKKEKKKITKEGLIIKDWGLEGDAHAGKYHKQISLLGLDSINKMQDQGVTIKFGELYENLDVEGLILHQLPLGTKLKIGEDILLEMTQIGKKESYLLEIDGKIVSSIMTKEGVFARVLKGGKVKAGDGIEVFPE